MSQYSRCHVSTIDESILAAISLDFDGIEKVCGLPLDGDCRYKLKEAAVEYSNAKETYRNIDAKKVKKSLREIVKAIDVILPFLSVLSSEFDQEAEESPIVQAVWKSSIPHSMRDIVSEGMMKIYLEKWRTEALAAQKLKGSPGQPSDRALRIFIHDHMHPIFLAAGGKGRGCHYDDSCECHVGGFYDMVLTMLRQIDSPKASDSNIAKIIMEIIPAS